jgi:hypothetical protein
MTANAGKGADGKPGQRSTGSGANSGRTRKKTSAAKQPSDEVTVRTDAEDDTNGSTPDTAEETVIDSTGKGDEDTVRDVEATKDSTPEPEVDDDATMVDVPTPPSPSASRSDGEEGGGRTSTFALPKDPGSDRPKTDASDVEKRPFEPLSRDDASNKSPESGESLPSSGRGAAMGSSTSRSYGSSSTASTPPSYAPSGSSLPSGSSSPAALESGSSASSGPSGPSGKLTGALRKAATAGRKPPRKAHLQVARFEPWSVMKFSFIMSLVCFLVLFVAVVVLYVILSWLGVFDALSNTIRDLTSNDQGKTGGLNPASWFSAARILGYTALIGTLNVLLITALATVWSVIYNMAADLVGGVEVTLKEADQ